MPTHWLNFTVSGHYKKMFGIEPKKVRTGYAKFNFRNPPINFTLVRVSSGKVVPAHLGIQLASTDEVMAMRERWIERGLFIGGEMNGGCCPAIENKIRIHDPDGNGWQFFAVSEDGFVETSVCCVSGDTNFAASCNPADISIGTAC